MNTIVSSSDQTSHFMRLPNEMITTVFGFLINAKDVIAIEKTCKLFRDIMRNNDYLWKVVYLNKWNFLPLNCSFFSQTNQKWKILHTVRNNIYNQRFSSHLESFHLQEIEYSVFFENNVYAIAKDEEAKKYSLFKCDFSEKCPRNLKKFSSSDAIIGFSGSHVVKIKYLNNIQFFNILIHPLKNVNSTITIGGTFSSTTAVFVINDWVITHVPQSSTVEAYSLQDIGKSIRIQSDELSDGIKEIQFKNGYFLFKTKTRSPKKILYFSDQISETPCKAEMVQTSYFSELKNCFIQEKTLYLLTFNFVLEVWDLESCMMIQQKNLKEKLQIQGNECLKLSDFDGRYFIFFTSRGRILIFDPKRQELMQHWYINLEIEFLKIIGENCITSDQQANIKLWKWISVKPWGIWPIEQKGHDEEFSWMMPEDKLVSIDFDGRYLKTLTQDGCYNVLDFLG